MSVLKDMSRSTMIIVAVIAVAGIASGLAYTAAVINSDNSSSAEYGLVSISNTDGTAASIQDVYSKTVRMTYSDESDGMVCYEFRLYDIKDDSILSDGSMVTVTMTPTVGKIHLDDGSQVDRISRSAFLSMTETGETDTLTIILDPVLVTSGADYSYDLRISLEGSDGNLIDIFDDPHISVKAYHAGASQ